MVNEFDPQAFGSVLARLDAQDRQLAHLQQEVSDLGDKIDTLILQGCMEKRSHHPRPDWMELIVGSILGAVAYFIGAKFMGG